MDSRIIIFAGGQGKRLRSLTTYKPKSMIDLAGRPILDYIIDEIEPLGISISLLVGRLGKKLIDYYKDRFSYIKFDPSCSLAYKTVVASNEYAEDNLILLNADTLLKRESIIKTLEYHNEKNPSVSINLATKKKPTKYRTHEIEGDKLIDVGCVEENMLYERIVHVINRKSVLSVEKKVPKKESDDFSIFGSGLSALIKILLEDGHEIRVVNTNDWFININTPEDLREAELYLSHANV